MAKARAILRKRIREDKNLDQFFDLEKSGSTEEALSFCKGIAKAEPVTEKTSTDEIAAFAPTWGFLPEKGDTEEVRSRLVAKACLMTEVISEADPRATGKVADETSRDRQPPARGGTVHPRRV